jgi:transposase, IS30 family
MGKYTQITHEERCVIAHSWRSGKSIDHIAKELKRGWETVKNEVHNNGRKNKFGKVIYEVVKAEKKLKKRRLEAREDFRIIENDWELQDNIDTLIVDKQYSPEQIAGHLALANDHKPKVNFQTIYKYIKRRDDNTELKENLRRQGKPQAKKESKDPVCKTAPKTIIDDRPAIINNKERLGDFEGDTVKLFGLEKFYTLVDRKSGYAKLKHCVQGTADTIHYKTIEIQQEISRKIYSITYDNGVEFAYHDLIKIDTKIDIYFAHTYSSWERGCNENFNGLLRQYFPKGMDACIITEDHVRNVEDLLNNRPRKRLNFLTPYQVFVLGLDPEKDGLKKRKLGAST